MNYKVLTVTLMKPKLHNFYYRVSVFHDESQMIHRFLESLLDKYKSNRSMLRSNFVLGTQFYWKAASVNCLP